MDAFVFWIWTYLFAAVPFGLVVSMWFGGAVDVRVSGSGNIGASNVARVHGGRVGAWVLLLDAAKGYLPVMVGGMLFPELGLAWPGFLAITAFLGHCFPIYLSFHGGKGVATSAGALAALVPASAGLAVLTWVGALLVTGRSSVASLAAASVLPVATWWLDGDQVTIVLILCVGVVLMHSSNLRRLIAGREERIVAPVRVGRVGDDGVDVMRLLEQGPAGGVAPPPLFPSDVGDGGHET